MTIAAIETRYAGCRFRSRLEARWAVFFDHLGIAWEYEPQGYVTSAGSYLPDFLVPDLNIWLEVKPSGDIDEDPRWSAFVAEAQTRLLVAHGLPWGDLVWGSSNANGWIEDFFFCPDAPEQVGWDNGRAFVFCPLCNRLEIHFEGRAERLSCHAFSERTFDGDNDRRILDAYRAARSARFEHGECG